ncbi:response regulator [Nostocaceae cyanobacterium CENA357]|uniref:Response regulator n=1 Tax=Atlanticothrix silvestris CENA357 TaxID=1725252 RepID=A0A8J7L4F4_9CYAN|nr:response regulator [Atlanticothrix silvestris]MBH8553562.1 response regulator [Atlanticothrix silvestris CENA357]
MSGNSFNRNPKNDTPNIDIFKGLTILVVDDLEDNLVLITFLLESYGIQVVAASNAKDGLEAIKQSPVDVLISDINMPEEDGYWLIHKIRSLTLPQKKDIPAIAITGHFGNQAREKALFAGFQTFLEKPLNLEQLIVEIAKLLKNSCKSIPA